MAGSVSATDVTIPVCCDGSKSAVQALPLRLGGAMCMEKAGDAGGDGGSKRQSHEAGRAARLRMVDIFFRSAVVAFLVVSLSAMLTSTQHSAVQVLGFSIPVSMKWSTSQPFESVVLSSPLIFRLLSHAKTK